MHKKRSNHTPPFNHHSKIILNKAELKIQAIFLLD